MQEQQEQPMITQKRSTTLVAMMPSPGMGHLIPMLEFAKRLTTQHDNLSVTFIIPTEGPPSAAQTTVLRSLPATISHNFLPPISLSDLPSSTKIEPLISLTVSRSLAFLRHSLRSLTSSHSVAALVVDLFGTDAFDVAKEFNIPSYVYFPSTAMALSFYFFLPHLDQTVQNEYKDLSDSIQIPGCVPVQGKDLLDPAQDRNNDAYKYLLHHAKRFRLANGIIENSFLELEPGAIKELQRVEPGRPPVYSVGPLVKVESNQTNDKIDDRDHCLKWLDEQPRGSVLFVCFGSGGTLSSAQIDELAYGLENSEQRFFWVVRSPNDKVANASYFIAQSHANPLDFLPKGFVERTQGRGLVVPSWAPQAQVLAHESTGGFLTHCGWNSILESVVNGVPLVAWPLYAEQKMNAVLVSEDVKVALRPKVGEDGLVGREEIASVVKRLMEGEEGKKIRYRMKELKEAASKTHEKNGTSTKQIAELANKWKGQEQSVDHE